MKKNKLILLILLAVILIPNIILAKDASSSILWGDMKNFFDVGYGLASSPFSYDYGDWAQVGLYASGTALLFTADKKIKSFTLDRQTSLNDKIFNFDTYYGNRYSLLLSAGIYGYGYIFKKNAVRKVGLQATEAFVYSGAIITILKGLIGRKRPYTSDSNLNFKPPSFFNDTYQALPSGHSTISFAVSTVLAKSIDNVFWKIFCYGSGGMVVASRIYHNKHWISDVFLGAVIGYKVGDYVVDFDKKKSDKVLAQHLYMGYNSVGLRFTF